MNHSAEVHRDTQALNSVARTLARQAETVRLQITVDDEDRPDNYVEPWTASAFYDHDGRRHYVAVGGGASIPFALRDLAEELELAGVFTDATVQLPPPGVPGVLGSGAPSPSAEKWNGVAL